MGLGRLSPDPQEPCWYQAHVPRGDGTPLAPSHVLPLGCWGLSCFKGVPNPS